MEDILKQIDIEEEYFLKETKSVVINRLLDSSVDSFWKRSFVTREINENKIEVIPSFSLGGFNISVYVEIDEARNKLKIKTNSREFIIWLVLFSLFSLLIIFYTQEIIPIWIILIIAFIPFWFFMVMRFQEKRLMSKLEKVLKERRLI
jgi:Flp pilus assembly protein TadB